MGEAILRVLSHPVWQGIGAILALVGLVVLLLDEKHRRAVIWTTVAVIGMFVFLIATAAQEQRSNQNIEQPNISFLPASATSVPEKSEVHSAACGKGTESIASAGGTITAVSATQGWQNSGVIVQAGNRVKVEFVCGSWSMNTNWGYVGPEGHVLPPDPTNVIPRAQPGALIGKVAQATYDLAKQQEVILQDAGYLYLQMNDQWLDDNDGTLFIRVIVQN